MTSNPSTSSSSDRETRYTSVNPSHPKSNTVRLASTANSAEPSVNAEVQKTQAPQPQEPPKIQNRSTETFGERSVEPRSRRSPKSKIQNLAADSFRMSFAPLSLDEVYQLADDGANGAIVVMSGMVRNQTDGKPVVALEYQAYEPMALNIFQQIATQIRQDWPDVTHVVIHHRTGKLTVGGISVLVAVGCPHRSEAFAACKYAIDTLKHNAPIWKKEHWGDGSTSWVSIGACEEE